VVETGRDTPDSTAPIDPNPYRRNPMRLPSFYTGAATSKASERFLAAYPDLPAETRTVWALYTQRFPGEADYDQRPFEVVWIADATVYSPSGRCAQCVTLRDRGHCPGMEGHLIGAARLHSELMLRPVAVAEFNVDSSTNHQGTARHIEQMLQRAWADGLIGDDDEVNDLNNLIEHVTGERFDPDVLAIEFAGHN
jgi:hypothetical protein